MKEGIQYPINSKEVQIPAGDDEAEAPVEQEAPAPTATPSLLPYLILGNGSIAFNTEMATAVDISEDIRKKTDLWSLSFTASPTVFLHRSQLRGEAEWQVPQQCHEYFRRQQASQESSKCWA